MGSGTSPDYCAWHFCAGDRVRHPRLGTGRVLWQQQNGTLVVRFDGKSKAVFSFPFSLNASRTLTTCVTPSLLACWPQ